MSDRDATKAHTVPVADDDGDIRIDRWFRRHFPGLAHGRLEKLLRTGQVRLDGGRVKASTRVSAGQKIRIPPLDIDDPPPPKSRAIVDPDDARRLRDSVLYRDDDVIAINKPPGLAVQGGSKVTRHLDAMLDELRFGGPERPRLVHRLDKDTGGVLLLARTVRAAARLAEAFRSKEAQKTYWALTVGVPKPPRGRIDIAIAKRSMGAGSTGSERVRPDDQMGKRAVTYYAVVDSAARKAAWVALRPITGRTHQLRVHCAAIGAPILGDGKYGGADAFMTGVPGGSSLMLHARAIEMKLPAGGWLRVSAPLSRKMDAAWRFFDFDPAADGDPFAGLET